jgi:ATP-dependent Lon protease
MTSKLYPFINVRNLVLYPGAEVALYIGRKESVDAILLAKKKYFSKVTVFTQKRSKQNAVPKSQTGMYSSGTLCMIESAVRMTDGTMKIKVRALKVIRAKKIVLHQGVRQAEIFEKSSRQDRSRGPGSEGTARSQGIPSESNNLS